MQKSFVLILWIGAVLVNWRNCVFFSPNLRFLGDLFFIILQQASVGAHEPVSKETELRDALFGAFNTCSKLEEYFTGAVDRYIYACKLEALKMVEEGLTVYESKRSISDIIEKLYDSKMKAYPKSLTTSLFDCTVDKGTFTLAVVSQSIQYCQELKNTATTHIASA